ncbi:UL87-like protein [Harp seal herpesvirus]|uniref:UL87-like protein n=1 Tax=phocid gammaherpesvirus 3 TaxID=2560643 RepID=A0A0R5Z685_9GAMA|nr:UL87-like protein [Harp seal herpesvirus]AJG42950.1 UL87-like protein [Harp seal herpesvirus]
MMIPNQPFLLPVHSTTQPKKIDLKAFCTDEFAFQVDIFSCLALNRELGGALATLEALDRELRGEKIFYTCRAVRRLLLGLHWYPVCVQRLVTITTVPGNSYKGPGLIISDAGCMVNEYIETHTYMQTINSLENTDHAITPWGVHSRVLYCPALAYHTINYSSMFRIICRYITMHELEECYSAFIGSLRNTVLSKTCTKNYFKLLHHLVTPSLVHIPVPAPKAELEFYKFSVTSFVNDWLPNSNVLHIKKKILYNLHKYSQTLLRLCKCDKYQNICISSSQFAEYQSLVKGCLPHLTVLCTKKNSANKPLNVQVLTEGGQNWYIYPINQPLYRVAMCMSVAECIEQVGQKTSHYINSGFIHPTLPQILTSMFQRAMYTPRDTIAKFSLQWITPPPQLCNSSHGSIPFANFAPIKHLSVNNFKINIFNTNMVINTKILYNKLPTRSESILNIPRLTNNFVVKKYSVKEPSFTISVFYSDDVSLGTAININFSGDMLNFVFAMGNLKCFLPITNILPVSIANWNSTLDLHGLENQQIVRSGRSDVFWTTNFPSAVSTKKGFSVSWFKAATATISKIHGATLAAQIINESTPILSSSMAKINPIKNTIFSSLEHRNQAQIQTLHKRFLECLYESTSFRRLDVFAIKNLINLGGFDFSKRMISHTKTKHECAIMGYKKCNMIPKVLLANKKVRLDELGRNANFMTFITRLGAPETPIKRQIRRHALRRFGIQWKLKNGKIKRELTPLPHPTKNT